MAAGSVWISTLAATTGAAAVADAAAAADAFATADASARTDGSAAADARGLTILVPRTASALAPRSPMPELLSSSPTPARKASASDQEPSAAEQAPPAAGVLPASLTSSLIEGSSEEQVLTVSNSGGSPLEFSVRVRAAGESGLCPSTSLLVTEFDSGELSSVDRASGETTTVLAGLQAPNVGTALSHDGKTLYVAESASGTIAAVNLASRTVTRIASGLGFPTGISLHPSADVLFVTEQTPPALAIVQPRSGQFARIPAAFELPIGVAANTNGTKVYVTEFGLGTLVVVDPRSGDMSTIASGLSEPWAVVLDASEVTAYVSERRSGTLARIDLLTGEVTRIAAGLSVPSGLSLDLANARIDVAETLRGTIAAADPYTGVVTRAGSGLDLSSPLGVLPSPSGECAPAAVSTSPLNGTVPPGGSVAVTVRFDARGLSSGSRRADLELTTNDPERPRIVVPATLAVAAAPDIAVSGEVVTVESTRVYTEDGARTHHTLPIVVPPSGGGTIELTAEGDFGPLGKTASLIAEGDVLGSAGETGADCAQATAVFPVAETRLKELVADGRLDVDVQNGPDVLTVCVPNQHRVRLRYSGRRDDVRFGSLFIGESRTLPLRIDNRGSGRLVGSIVSDSDRFVPETEVLDVPPRSFRELAVTFRPEQAGAASGTLTIESNDPDAPVVRVELSGTGLSAPVLNVEPALLESTLSENGHEERVVTIRNPGGSPLSYGVKVEAASPSSGSLAARGADGVTPAEGIELLAPSPAPLTCVVEDPAAGVLYAQAYAGTAFYRYVASTGSWETLASAPVAASNNGGAALLDGKIYTVYPDDGTVLGVYDVASNVWSIVANPLRGGETGNIASDGSRFLYFVVSGTFLRWDPQTGSSVSLPPPPVLFSRWGGLRFAGGRIFGHQGNGSTGFAVYDVEASEWTLLEPAPGGAVMGATIDPLGRSYFASGSYGGRNVYRYAIDAGVWSVATNPHFTFNDGGLAWLPGSIYLVQGEGGTGFGRLAVPAFLTLSSTQGIVPPGGSAEVVVRFDASGLLAGAHRGVITVTSNDPQRQEATVPATLFVEGPPHIAVLGQRVTIESAVDYTTDGATTVHALPIVFPPAAGGTVALTAEGDYGDPIETATATAELKGLGSVGGTVTDCIAAEATYDLSPGLLGSLAVDGSVTITVRNSAAVNTFCAVNRHTIQLVYVNPADQLDFHTVAAGEERTIDLLVADTGIDQLNVFSIASDEPAFVPDDSAATVPPRSSRPLRIRFRPPSPGNYAGLLVLSSNDPDVRDVSIPLIGKAADAPP